MDPNHALPGPLRRIGRRAALLPLVLLTAAVMTGCGSGEDFDDPDPVSQVAPETASQTRVLSAQSTLASEASDPAIGFARPTERPAPSVTVPVLSAKPR